MSRELRLVCPCGVMLVGASEDEVVKRAEEHLGQEHPDLAGEYTREQILALAEWTGAPG